MQTLNNTLSGVHPLSAQEIPYWKQYYEANKQKRQEYVRKYARKKYKENPDKYKQLTKKYAADNAETVKHYHKQHRIANAEKIAAYQKEYAAKNKKPVEKVKVIATKEQKRKEYYNLNKEKIIARDEIYRKKRKQTDELYKFKCLMRQSVYNAFVRIKANKPAKTETLLGCTWQQAKEHFEKLFEPGMTWQNHGEWHIDHIKPVSSFTMENLHEMNHISNLQPLWAEDNLTKHNKIINT